MRRALVVIAVALGAVVFGRRAGASAAQYALLTAENPVFVRHAYKTAQIAGGMGFSVESEAAQVRIFHSLGLFPENCGAAFEGLGMNPADVGAA